METNKHVELNLNDPDTMYYVRTLTKDFSDMKLIDEDTYEEFCIAQEHDKKFQKIRDNFTIEELKERLETWKLMNL